MNGAAPLVAEASQLAHPVAHHFLQFGERRAALPGNPQGAHAGAGDITQHRRQRGIGGKPAVVHGMLYLGDTRHDDLLKVCHQVAELLHSIGRVGG